MKEEKKEEKVEKQVEKPAESKNQVDAYNKSKQAMQDLIDKNREKRKPKKPVELKKNASLEDVIKVVNSLLKK